MAEPNLSEVFTMVKKSLDTYETRYAQFVANPAQKDFEELAEAAESIAEAGELLFDVLEDTIEKVSPDFAQKNAKKGNKPKQTKPKTPVDPANKKPRAPRKRKSPPTTADKSATTTGSDLGIPELGVSSSSSSGSE